jgi:predicted permease
LITLLLSVFTTVLFALAPALIASRLQLVPYLKNESTFWGGHRRLNLRNLFVVAQVAFSILLLIGAGLLLRTLWNASRVNPGFDPSGAVVGSIDLAKQGYTQEQGKAFYRQLLERLKNTGGLQGAGLAFTVPVQRTGMRIVTKDHIAADFNIVSPGYFRALGVPILSGRAFEPADTEKSELVAIVNEALARQISASGNVIGKFINDVGPESASARIVGVVPDVRYRNLREPATSMLYVSCNQFYKSRMTVIIRSMTGRRTSGTEIMRTVADLNKDLPVYNLQTLEQKLNASLVQEQILASLLTTFGLLALLLAGIGVYSLLSYLAQIRTREMGVRMAVGASRQDVLLVIVSHGIALTTLGIFTGVLLSMPASRLVRTWLYGITPFDGWTYAGITLMMVITSLLASYFPARRAAKLDPIRALRYE